jgi:hypothetical protein
LKDGRSALALWCCLWLAASFTLSSVWWAAILYALFPPPFKAGRMWGRWGALAAAVGLLVLSVARGSFVLPPLLTWVAGYDWLGPRGFLVPLLLVWLGAAFVGKKSPIPWWVGQLAGWTLAWAWAGFQDAGWMGPDVVGLWWLSATGFGLAALRRDLMDRSWHATVLWMSLAVVLWAAF